MPVDLFTTKLPITAVQPLNNEALPTFEEHNARIDAVLSDNGREFCGRPDQHPYELFLQLEGIEHKRTKVSRPQSNGIMERLRSPLLDEHFGVEGRKTWFETVAEMQTALDTYLIHDNQWRPHQRRDMYGRPPSAPLSKAFPNAGKREAKTLPPSPRNLLPPDPTPEAKLSGDYHFCAQRE